MESMDTAQVADLLGLTPPSAAGPSGDAVPDLDMRVGRNVRLARVKAGLGAAQIAEATGLSKDKLSKIEHGKRRVSPRELPALARALSVPVAALLGVIEAGRPALALAHRVGTGLNASTTSRARVRAVALLEAEDRLARRVDLPARALSPAGAAMMQLAVSEYTHSPRTSAEARRQGRALAEEVRRVLELGSSDIVDLPGLIEMHFAVDVALSPLGSNGSDGLCARDGSSALLVVNTDYPLGRTRFTLAHELGHHLLNDAREVIEEGRDDMFAKTFTEQRVNAFAGHLLLPLKAVTTTMIWLGASKRDIAANTTRGRAAVGYLMVRYGVSLPCALQQLLEAGFVTLAQKLELTDTANPTALSPGGLVRAAEPLLSGRTGPEKTLREQRPPARLAAAVLDAARAGTVGMNTVAAVLGRPDDDALFDEVMYGAPPPATM